VTLARPASLPLGALLGQSGELRAEEVQLAGVADDVDRLDELAAHGEHQHAGEFLAGEGEHGGLTAGRERDQRRALAPEAEQVPRDAFRAFKDSREFGDPRPEVDIAPGIGGQYAEEAVEVAV